MPSPVPPNPQPLRRIQRDLHARIKRGGETSIKGVIVDFCCYFIQTCVHIEVIKKSTIRQRVEKTIVDQLALSE